MGIVAGMAFSMVWLLVLAFVSRFLGLGDGVLELVWIYIPATYWKQATGSKNLISMREMFVGC